MPKLNPNTANLKGIKPLYRTYAGQFSAQKVHLSLDTRTGDASIDYDGEIGNAVPAPVYHGLVRRFLLPNNANGPYYRNLFTNDWVVDRLQRVLDGATSFWDGNNMRGRLTLEAGLAAQELYDELEPSPFNT